MTAETLSKPASAAGPSRYSTVAIMLHWLIAAALIFQVILGWRADDGPKGATTFALFQLHKSIGITILVLSVARLIWKLTHKSPPAPAGQPTWEKIAAHAVHVGFYVIMIGLPLTGWIIVSTSRINIPTLLYGAIPWPHLPGLPELAESAKQAWNDFGHLGHGLLVKFTYLLLALHLGAVAKHQILDRDEVFGHMAAGAKPGLKEPRLWLAAAGFAAVVAAAYLYTPAKAKAPAP
ncbi:cytochrome B, partial [Caulobacter sp. D4A]